MRQIGWLRIIWLLSSPILYFLFLSIYRGGGASEEQIQSYSIGIAIGVLIFLIYVVGDQVISYFVLSLTAADEPRDSQVLVGACSRQN